MPVRKYDYLALEAEFVREPGLSVRELARRHGIAQERVSSLHEQARRLDASGYNWYQKRERYEAKTENKTIELASDHEARRRVRQMAVRDHAIEVIDQYLTAAERDIKATHTVTRKGREVNEPLIRVGPKEIGQLMDRLSPLFATGGAPLPEGSDFGATATLSFQGSTPAAAGAALAGLTAFARDRAGGVEPATVGTSPLPLAPDPRQDEQP